MMRQKGDLLIRYHGHLHHRLQLAHIAWKRVGQPTLTGVVGQQLANQCLVIGNVSITLCYAKKPR
ncbi:MAG: hypothetical protein JWR44_1728 [Hymenobacter sp.]|jgi:hypothetical protein|nr:hypothetical protein [Hymenobacter sp.]